MKFYLVGGAVRDELLGVPVKERDWVVVGASPQAMKKLGFQLVGKEFPVFLHPTTREEYALARTEKKTDPGYKGFQVDASPDVSLNEDLIRRDLTINAMARDEAGHLIDPYGGKQDLEQKVLRHVSPAFKEDPVRILRIARFLARYQSLGFHIDPATLKLMKDMVHEGEVDALVAERVFKELDRALMEPNPEAFFLTLAECDALPILFPGLKPDGKLIAALKSASKLSVKPVVRFAALLYDYPECATKQLSTIRELCQRYRTPAYYQELAELVKKHHTTITTQVLANADELLNLFYALDIFRRKERFDDFVLVMQAINVITPKQAQEFNSAAEIARAADIKPILKKGLDGKELGHEIRKLRLEQLEKEFAIKKSEK